MLPVLIRRWDAAADTPVFLEPPVDVDGSPVSTDTYRLTGSHHGYGTSALMTDMRLDLCLIYELENDNSKRGSISMVLFHPPNFSETIAQRVLSDGAFFTPFSIPKCQVLWSVL